jgi:hypothetical protein
MNLESKKLQELEQEHDKVCKNGAIDPVEAFVATIGQDGTVHIYQLKPNDEVKFVTKITQKIAQLPMDQNKQFLELSWSPMGSFLMVTGMD